MIREFRGFLIITVILITIREYQAAKKDIVNWDDGQPAIDNKTRVTAKLARKCLLDRKILLAVSEKLNNKLVNYLHRSETTSFTSLASSKLFVHASWFAASKDKKLYYDHRYYRFLWKSAGFLIAAYSPANLKEQLDNLKDSQWWNPAGIFLLIEDESNSSIPRCSNADDFLSLAWKYGLLSTVFLCQELDGTASMYSYNPYGFSAPRPWLKCRELEDQKGHPWSLFKWKKYDGRSHSCETVFFDKTASLNGYPIFINALELPPFLSFTQNRRGLMKYNGEDGMIMKNIWHFLNASIVEVPISKMDAFLGWTSDNGTFHGNLIDIGSGKVDIGLNSMMIQPVWKVTTTYPHNSLNLCFVTKNQGNVPWLIGLAMVFDKITMMCALATFLISAFIFGYVDRRRYSSGFMNTLRVFVSSSFMRPPSLDGLRMILCFVFLLPITFNSTIQGKILHLIRHPIKYASLETMDELETAEFHVEGFEAAKSFITEPEILKSFIPAENLDTCLHKLYTQKRVACIHYCFNIFVRASYLKTLHVAEEQSANHQNRYIAKPDWPLVDRFNVVLRRIVEAGLTDFYRTKTFDDTYSHHQHKTSDDTVVLTLHDFYYVFMALGIGWLLATLTFIIELFISRSKIR